MSKFIVYKKGKQVSPQISARIFENESSVGIFESLRTYGKRIFRLEEHLRRFQESVKSIGCLYPVSTTDLKKELHAALKAYQGQVSKLDLSVSDLIADIQQNVSHKTTSMRPVPDLQKDLFLRLCFWENQIFVFVGERKHPQHIYESGVSLKTSPVKRTHTNAQTSQVKTSAYHNAFLASLEIKAENIYEWVFLDVSGYVTEVRIGNLFMVKRGKLYTPPEDGILNGVTRGVVIECALRNRLEVEETRLTRHDIFNADEAFLTNTSWEILPIAKLDGRTVGKYIPGSITKKLQSTFKEIVEKDGLQKVARRCKRF